MSKFILNSGDIKAKDDKNKYEDIFLNKEFHNLEGLVNYLSVNLLEFLNNNLEICNNEEQVIIIRNEK
jgi:hypothetical protein